MCVDAREQASPGTPVDVLSTYAHVTAPTAAPGGTVEPYRVDLAGNVCQWLCYDNV